MSALAMWWRDYRDHGFVGTLGLYTMLSYAAAAIIWFSPYSGLKEQMLFKAWPWLGAMWLLIVIRGSFTCGWPALVLWLPIYWALYRPLAPILLAVACIFGSCV